MAGQPGQWGVVRNPSRRSGLQKLGCFREKIEWNLEIRV